MWVQLTTIWYGDTDGVARAHYPGEWVDISKALALRLVAERGAVTARPVDLSLPAGCGVVVPAEDDRARGVLGKVRGLAVVAGEARLAFERTLLWDPAVPMRLDLLPVGFRLVQSWQVAAPLASFTDLAVDLGSPAERERTAATVHDLRVPVYEPRLVFLQRCADTERLMELWREERGGDGRLALLRALYRAKTTVLPLPPTWASEK